MTLGDIKKKVLTLIEEADTEKTEETNDPDIELKLNHVINAIQFELSRYKKIPGYIELDVEEGDTINFAKIEKKTKCKIYQIEIIKGVSFDSKANGTIFKILESGIAEIDYYKYPTVIDENTSNDYEMELSLDALEIMPYGVAADVLKADVSNSYGQIYATRYNQMIQTLDSRNAMPSMEVEGGFDV